MVERKMHYKKYKTEKFLLTAGLSTTLLTAGMWISDVHADSINASSSTASVAKTTAKASTNSIIQTGSMANTASIAQTSSSSSLSMTSSSTSVASASKVLQSAVSDAKQTENVHVVKDPDKVISASTVQDGNAKIEQDYESQASSIKKQIAQQNEANQKYQADLKHYQEITSQVPDKNTNITTGSISQNLKWNRSDGVQVQVTLNGSEAQQTVFQLDKSKTGMQETYINQVNLDSTNAVIISANDEKGISGKFATAEFNNLSNVSYIDQTGKTYRIARIEEIFSNLLPGTSGGSSIGTPNGRYKTPMIAIYNDPAEGFWYCNSDGVTVEYRFYDDQGNLINFNGNAYLAVASMDAWYSNDVDQTLGHQALTGYPAHVTKATALNDDARAIGLYGSSVTVHDGKTLYSDQTNTAASITDGGIVYPQNATSWQGKTDWNQPFSAEDIPYYGAGLIELTGNTNRIFYHVDRNQSDSNREVWVRTLAAIPQTAEPEKPQPVVSITIHYHANQLKVTEHAKVVYYDDTTHQVIQSETLSGELGSQSTYDAQKVIRELEQKHYQLISDAYSPTKGMIFNQDNGGIIDAQNTYFIRFVHQTEDIKQSETYTEEINFLKSKTNENLAPAVHKQLIFNRLGKKDLVTKQVSWGAWDYQLGIFKEFNVPEIAGYTVKQNTVDAIYILPAVTSQHDFVKNVYYDPQVEQISVVYLDQATGKILKNVTLLGDANSISDYQTATEINQLEAQHYRLIKDEFTATHGNVFQPDNLIKQYFVYFTHAIKIVNDSKIVTRTIKYRFDSEPKNDAPAAPTVIQKLEFTRNGQQDEVTGVIDWNNWSEMQAFEAVDAPQIIGFVPLQTQTQKMWVNANSGDLEQIIYYVPVKDTNPSHGNFQPEIPDSTKNPSFNNDNQIESTKNNSDENDSHSDENNIKYSQPESVSNSQITDPGFVETTGEQTALKDFGNHLTDKNSTSNEKKSAAKKSEHLNSVKKHAKQQESNDLAYQKLMHEEKMINHHQLKFNFNKSGHQMQSMDANAFNAQLSKTLINQMQNIIAAAAENSNSAVHADTVSGVKKALKKQTEGWMIAEGSTDGLPETGNTKYTQLIAFCGAVIAAIAAAFGYADRKKQK